MNKKNINIGLMGCGHLGSIHSRLINEICKTNGSVSFAGVYDIDMNKTNQAAENFNVKAFDSLDSLLSAVDTLVVVTSTPTHFDIAKKALSKQINLFIEKPVTSSLEEAVELIRISKYAKVKIQVGHVERFNSALTSLDGYNLDPKFIESHRLSQFNPRGTDVSVIQDLMIHDLDIILQLVKSPLEKIDANGVAVISSRVSLKKMRKMRIFQQNAYISIDFLQNKSEIFKLEDINTKTKGLTYPVLDSKKIIYEEPATENNANPIKNELETFIDSILNDKHVKVSLDEGKQA